MFFFVATREKWVFFCGGGGGFSPAALLYVSNQAIPLTGSQFLAQSYVTVSVVAS